MEKYSNTILNKQGKPVVGALVTVTTYPGNEPATIYATDGGPAVPSVTSDDSGRFSFYAADGHYNLRIVGDHIEPITITDVVLNDPNDDGIASLASPDGAALVGFRPGNNVMQPRSVEAKLRDFLNIKDFGAKGDGVTSDTPAFDAFLAEDKAAVFGPGYYPNSRDATFTLYPDMRNRSGGYKIKQGVPGSKATTNRLPILWVEKASNAQRTDGGPNYFDAAFYSQLTLEPTATAFGTSVCGYVRSAAGDVLTAGKFVDAIGVHGSGKAIGRNGRVWGLWGQASNADDGSGIPSSQVIACELNTVNNFAAQAHPENLPAGEGPYRGLIVTTADGGAACGIGVDVGNGAGLPAGQSGWWIGLRLRKDAIVPSGANWKTVYLEDTQQLKIEGTTDRTLRYGAIRIGPRNDGTGDEFTYGLNAQGSTFQDSAAVIFDPEHRIYWGPSTGSTKYIGYDATAVTLDLHNLGLSVNNTKVIGTRKTGWGTPTGIADKSTFATYTAPTIGAAYSQTQLQALADACQVNSRHIAALISDLRLHGLIGD